MSPGASLLEASNVIGEVQQYCAALPVNLPAFARHVQAHSPMGIPEEWRSIQEYTLKDLHHVSRMQWERAKPR